LHYKKICSQQQMKNPESPQHADESYVTHRYPYGDPAQSSDESLVDWVDRINRRAYRRALQERFVGAGPDLKRKLGKA
jgi:hypothetical protein